MPNQTRCLMGHAVNKNIMATPLFGDADFVGVPPTLPTGVTVPTNPNHLVQLSLSTGDTVVFGTVLNMMKLITKMRLMGVHCISPQEDVFILLAGATKMIFGEQTFQNQKLQNAGTAIYSQGKLQFAMRSQSCIQSLDEALACVGHYRTMALQYETTYDLLQPTGVHSPRLIVVDADYDMAPARTVDSSGNVFTSGTHFEDNPPLFEPAPPTVVVAGPGAGE